MNIRTKCALLVIVFELTLAVSILLTVYLTKNYFEAAAESFAASRRDTDAIGRLRSDVIYEMSRLARPIDSDAEANKIAQGSEHIDQQLRSLTIRAPEALLTDIEQSNDDRRTAVKHALDSRATRPAAFTPEAHRAFDLALSRLQVHAQNELSRAVAATTEAQTTTTIILFSNMIVGVVLGLLALYLIRRWVILPVNDLQKATNSLARGDRNAFAPIRTPDELGQLAAAFNQMTGQIGRMEQRLVQRERIIAMSELVSYIAHNIRNPLAGVQSSAEITCHQAADNSQIVEQQRHIIAAIDRCLRWFKQIEHACGSIQIEPRETNLHELVQGVLTVFRPLAGPQRINLHVIGIDQDVTVCIDTRHVEQAITAIIGNAIDAIGTDGDIELSHARDDDHQHWSLSISDSGGGIDPKIIGRLFEPTFSTKPDGHGLGLFMARKVAEMHGGELKCYNNERGGATFTFTFPLELDGYPNDDRPADR